MWPYFCEVYSSFFPHCADRNTHLHLEYSFTVLILYRFVLDLRLIYLPDDNDTVRHTSSIIGNFAAPLRSWRARCNIGTIDDDAQELPQVSNDPFKTGITVTTVCVATDDVAARSADGIET